MTEVTMPGRTGPLPTGWHRVTWKQFGKDRYIVTDSISSATTVEAMVKSDARSFAWITDVDLQSWQPGGAT